MARATIGIALGGAGTDVALETADVALMGDDLSRLPFAIALSRASHTVIQQNLWAAFEVVALLIPATLFGLASMGIAVLFHERGDRAGGAQRLSALALRRRCGRAFRSAEGKCVDAHTTGCVARMLTV